MDDFEAAFAEASAEVEANPDAGSDATLPQQATIHMGDEESTIGESESDDSLDLDGPDDDSDTPEVSDEETSVDEDDADSDTPDGFDWTAHKDAQVTLKINGEDVSVPLGEAMNGYMRQQDYTRKTQELSGMRRMVDAAQQMKSALESDPHGTIRQLAEVYGLDLAGSVEDDPYHTEDPEMAPVMQKLKASEQRQLQMERQLQAQQEEVQTQRILQEVRQEMATVKAEFADFVPENVLPIAAEKDLSIREAYILWKGEDMIRESAAAKTAAAKAAQVAATQAKARNASNQVGKGARKASSRPVTDETFDSFEDMLTHAFSSQ